MLQARVFERLGFDVEIFGWRDPDGDAAVPQIPGNALRLDSAPATMTGQFVQSPGIVKALEAVLARSSFVHLNGPFRGTNGEIARACCTSNVPFIYSPRGSLDCSAVDLVSQADRPAISRHDALLVGRSGFVHVTSRREATFANWPCQPSSAVIIPNVVDLSGFAPASEDERRAARRDLGIKPNCPALIHFGRIVPEKNLEFLVEVLATLELPEARLFLVGNSNGPAAAAVRKRAERLGLSSQIELVGEAREENRRKWVIAADLHLIPSLGENFCLSLVEAVACGRPVIASPEVGALEFMKQDDVAVTPLDHECWRTAIRAALQQRPDRDPQSRYDRLSAVFLVDPLARLWDGALRAHIGADYIKQ
jgi:glycosyltransferase involved in cell wall biosynthesis